MRELCPCTIIYKLRIEYYPVTLMVIVCKLPVKRRNIIIILGMKLKEYACSE